jgi:type IV pilus assembly protein PilQ
MRLKQLLGIILLLLAITVMAAASASRLTNVSVASQGSVTTVTLQASGTYTHNEYRPTDTLLLVDLAGVSADKLNERTRSLQVPGVKGYRVVGYKGAAGADVTRVELNLEAGSVIQVSQANGGVAVQVSAPSLASAPAKQSSAAAAPANPAKADAPAAAPKPAAGKIATVNDIAVVRGTSGLEVQISATAPIAPKAMKLVAPDRVVLDLPNAVLAGKARTINVNDGDLKSVRMARFQLHPPVTRVVVDLASRHDFDILATGNKLTLKLKASPKAVAEAPQPEPSKPEAQSAPAPVLIAAATTPEPKPALQADAPPPTQANEFAMVEANYKPKEAAAEVKPAPKPEPVAAVKAEPKETSKPPEPEMLPKASASMKALPAMNTAQMQQQQLQGAPSRARYTGEPISVNLKDVDLRDFFRLVHEISGLNIVLDPNVKGSLTLVLDDVPWDQALDIVLKNNALDRQLDGNVLRIATLDTLRREADARRAQAEAQALAVDKVTITRFLSYAHSKDVMPTIKKFLSQRGEIISDDRTNALIIQDIPTVVPEIDRLLGQLDRKTQEVEIEARVIAATRNFARDIGTQLGFAWGNRSTAVGGVPGVGTMVSPIGVPQSPGTTSVNGAAGNGRVPTPNIPAYILSSATTAIPLFSNLAAGTGDNPVSSGFGLTNATGAYRIDAILTMAESRGLLKILSRPRVVTQNNVQALVRQGLRIPVVTLGQLGGPPTVTYIDAFLRLTVTPQITIENTIFMNLDVENTTADFGRTVGGNPTLVTQQATTQVLVTDGGTVVFGGVIQTQNNVATQQVPLLGEIPILGNLFKRRTVSTSTQELIFFVTPKIIQT